MEIDPIDMGTWYGLGISLSLSVPYVEWREAPWLRVVITDGDELGRVRAFELVEAPHRPQIEAAIERWFAGRETGRLAHPADHLFGLRFSTVGHLLLSLDGFLPPPQESESDGIYRRFLFDWWAKHGALYAVGYSCSEHDIKG